ncbi:hypothetical protein PVAG01_02887 [Phlyctema vagabunda]|uniref:Uncharacterized protein n=1 Tax=Phlyctema vagabunda TaxID=108571 RepID=A0ABR4PT70_9HELO
MSRAYGSTGHDGHQRIQGSGSRGAFEVPDDLEIRNVFDVLQTGSSPRGIRRASPASIIESRRIPRGHLCSRAEAATFVIYEDETAQPEEPGFAVTEQYSYAAYNIHTRPQTPETASWTSGSVSTISTVPLAGQDPAALPREENMEIDENINPFIHPQTAAPDSRLSPAAVAPGTEELTARKRRKVGPAAPVITPRMASPISQRELLANTLRQFLRTPGYMLVPNISSSASRRASQMKKRKRDESQPDTEQTRSSSESKCLDGGFDVCFVTADETVQQAAKKAPGTRRNPGSNMAYRPKCNNRCGPITKARSITKARPGRMRSAGI